MTAETLATLTDSDPWPKRRDLKQQTPGVINALLGGARAAITAWTSPSSEYVAKIENLAQLPGALEPGGVLYRDIGNEDYTLRAHAAIGHQQMPQPPATTLETY